MATAMYCRCTKLVSAAARPIANGDACCALNRCNIARRPSGMVPRPPRNRVPCSYVCACGLGDSFSPKFGGASPSALARGRAACACAGAHAVHRRARGRCELAAEGLFLCKDGALIRGRGAGSRRGPPPWGVDFGARERGAQGPKQKPCSGPCARTPRHAWASHHSGRSFRWTASEPVGIDGGNFPGRGKQLLGK